MVALLQRINGFVWGAPALVGILGTGIWLSLRTGFAQIRLFPSAWRHFLHKLRAKPDGQDGVSPFQTLCTALAATVGTGNIAGVAGAIALGGPGAIFWLWICALFGMITKFAEAVLSSHYRVQDSHGRCMGGPMYVIERGLGKRFTWLGKLYCFFGVIAAFGVGNATQVNAVLVGFDTAFSLQPSATRNVVIGACLAVVTALVLLGGAKRIGSFAEKIVPFAAVSYIVLGLGVVAINYARIPAAFSAIFRGAFTPEAVTGGAVGSAFLALRTGVSRGVFTNEAGMGTAGMSYASADVEEPVEQGMMGIIEVFLDTVVICTVTALAILCSGTDILYGTDEGAALTSRAFSGMYGPAGSTLLALFLCCFAFATMIGWGLYGVRCAQYLLGEGALKPFVLIQTLVVTVCSLLGTGTVWMLAETVNGLMAIPNLFSLLILAPVVGRMVKNYQQGTVRARGGTYESFNQCKPLRALSHEKIPSSCGGGGAAGKEDLSSEYWPA